MLDLYGGGLPQSEEPDVTVIGVWSDCWESVEVFQLCQPQLLAGMSGLIWTGVNATEILSGCKLLRINKRRRAGVAVDVQLMASVVSRLNNDTSERR